MSARRCGGRFQRLQSLEDAIAYRRARVGLPCAECERALDGERCDDHACDLDLIAAYQREACAVIVGLSREVATRRAVIAGGQAAVSGDVRRDSA